MLEFTSILCYNLVNDDESCPGFVVDLIMSKKQLAISHLVDCLTSCLPFLIFIVFQMTFVNCLVSGCSMEPTLHPYDYVLGVKHPTGIKVGDIVMIKAPDRDDGALYVKRVAAVGGDTIDISEEGALLITHSSNGIVEITSYKVPYNRKYRYPLTLERDKLYVLGDNSTNSNDSRNYGEITTNEVIAKAVFHIDANFFTKAIAKIRF